MGNQSDNKDARILAEEHWAWLEDLLHKIYVEAMVHGFGHGYESRGKEIKDVAT